MGAGETCRENYCKGYIIVEGIGGGQGENKWDGWFLPARAKIQNRKQPTEDDGNTYY